VEIIGWKRQNVESTRSIFVAEDGQLFVVGFG
jgi:hypothetical protein